MQWLLVVVSSVSSTEPTDLTMCKTSVNHNQENNFVLIVTHFLFLNPGAVLTFLHVHRQFLLLLLFALYVLGQNFLELGSLLLAHLELLFKSTNSLR